ncbi:hypothetical protein [Paenibacillus odorifer]|uniref:hypothetical protein n=1 Tax=Paenibacillus TaxID=44249 RepID=UPI0015C3AE29|nr:hypothetical protein [Paenibacillus odorifer]
MDKEKTRALFELLLADYKQSERIVIDEYGGDPDELERTIEEYREELNELLK